jgi:hypothetical protein
MFSIPRDMGKHEAHTAERLLDPIFQFLNGYVLRRFWVAMAQRLGEQNSVKQ